MHAAERESIILDLLDASSFISFRDLEERLDASPATIRRDLERLATAGKIERVHGGAKLLKYGGATSKDTQDQLLGTPFDVNISRNRPQKKAIGHAAAKLCVPEEGIMIDGGTTTFQMCPHLKGLNLQVLTNSLHIVSALLPQQGTRILVPAGTVFREQNIILSAAGEESMPRFYAPKLFMGAAAIGPQGLMQADVVLVAAERRLVDRADEIIVLADASKFDTASGNVVCGLDQIDTIITDDRISTKTRAMLEKAGVKLIVVSP